MHTLHLAIRRVDVIRMVCASLAGEQHTFTHRGLTGTLVMLSGVYTAHHFGHSPNLLIALAGDAVGYALHGLGLIPFVDQLIMLAKVATE